MCYCYVLLSDGKYGDQEARLYNMVVTDTKTSGDIFERDPDENVPVLKNVGMYTYNDHD